jgi:hypothetical protein
VPITVAAGSVSLIGFLVALSISIFPETTDYLLPILYSLVWPDRGSNPQSIALDASTLTITLAMRFPICILFYYHK